MNSFTYYNPAKISFGVNAINRLEDFLVKLNTKSILLIYSGDFIKELGIYETIKRISDKLNITFIEDGRVVPNPKIELVRELVVKAKEHSVDLVLAVGGGSSIDTAKAVALGIKYDKDVWDFFENGVIAKDAANIGVISTLPSSGSESSNAAIISNGLLKLGYEDDLIIPKFAIMDPSYTLTLPAYQTAVGVADILAHLLERYFTNVNHVDITDYLLEGAIKSILLNGKRIVKEPDNLDYRSEIQWTATIAHNNLLDTGREADWGSHRIEHELSAQYDITHGEGMAVVFVAWTKYMAKYKASKLAQLANRVFNVDYNNYSESEMAYILSEKLKSFFKNDLGLKTTLDELQITDEQFKTMALRATKNDTTTVGHYLPLNATKIVEILELARR
ncbi:MAG: iron-containing alcohol dehydrogenase [Lachnospiraceae bacterium]|nr:iron-containing alcohol dehydrogenase [Lachnospiraceae bacterium]